MSENSSDNAPGPGRKRKASSDYVANGNGIQENSLAKDGSAVKKPRATKSTPSTRKGKTKDTLKIGRSEVWPEYFESLFKVFKALNAVIAFCSSRKHLALTFPVVRTSVESLLKQPLELAKVAELKALLPDLIQFAYIPSIELRIHAECMSQRSTDTADYTITKPKTVNKTEFSSIEDDEHVLILDFADGPRGQKSANVGIAFGPPPAMTPAATKKLVEKRNNRFTEAVNEVLEASRSDEDPVVLLQSAAREHIPVDPTVSITKGKNTAVPEPNERPSIDTVIQEMQEKEWYAEQIVHRRTVEAKDGQLGILDTPLSETIQTALQVSRKISSLYVHQAASINALMQGNNVIVSTSTASGKSVIYQVPLLTFLEDDPEVTAIFIYPTKASIVIVYSEYGIDYYDGRHLHKIRKGPSSNCLSLVQALST
ncbi:hypothetical protein EUX98_g1173 [Antrodiella citrinella]|uniref:CDT1 Geminin-binding domain-containing protein n=1 Tax=Antrodiella citrinella TaxID=2447956 RepID=A0A4S4N4Z7_9APHY|nr:hypothetical protein EUX98_g1173 [Antrodiella citrinella]